MSITTETGKITLGDRVFPVAALTFDQLQRVAAAFPAIMKPLAEGGVDAMRAIIKIALEDQVTEEELGEIRTDLTEIMTAVNVVGRISGLEAAGEIARMIVAARSTGMTSTPA
jgi:hypothetical protein